MISFKFTQFTKVTAAFNEALAIVLGDFDPKTVLNALSGNAEKLAQYLRLVLTALVTKQSLVLAGGQERTARPFVLEALSTRTVAAIEKFVAKDHFKVGTIQGVKIAYVGDNFQKVFLGKVETDIAGTVLRSYKLLVRSLDHIIRTDLGDNHTSYLGYIWELMAAQPNGEEGSLLTNGYANIFYVQDDDGIFWAVYVDWRGDGWSVDADSVDYPLEWYACYRVFGC